MKSIVITDLHFTDKKRDEYRFKIFDILKEFINNNKVDNIYILGDLTDFKDHHSSYLVNKICTHLIEIAVKCKVILLKGNHDYIEENHPFFEFLKYIANIYYINTPVITEGILLLPHTKDFTQWGSPMVQSWAKEAEFIFMHQPVNGAKVYDSYYLTNCLNNNIFEDNSAIVISGDIHTPQSVGNVIYVGAPYPIKFGDNYRGKFLYIDENEIEEIPVDLIRKLTLDINTIDDLKKIEFKKDDQVKIRLFLYQSEFYKWSEYKTEIKKYMDENHPEIEVCGICTIKDIVRKKLKTKTETKEVEEFDVFESFCKKNGIDKTTQEIGLELVK